MNHTRKIMFLGTGSDVGKSICTTAFCRILKNRGIKVAPFKAQNMSNNSFVTIEGGEIGRAQVAQAESCGLTPTSHMNPVLLKPTSDMGSQVVLCGKVHGNMKAKEYYAFKSHIREKVKESYQVLESQYEAIVMEGAGSCGEVNLREHDLVNFEMALMSDSPVVLVADIDRGGVFAQIIGSLEIISPQERDLVAGFIINKFRGDPDLFRNGIEYIENRTGKPVFGVVPYYNHIKIDTEDSMSLDMKTGKTKNRPSPDKINFAIVRLPHVSNFTDLEVLEEEPDVRLSWLREPREINEYDVIVIPGSKCTISDMMWMKEKGWDSAIRSYMESKRGTLVGLCGGFQILGTEIRDPLEIEGSTKTIEALGLIDTSTEIEAVKVVKRSSGKDAIFNAYVEGYEIHMGKTVLSDDSVSFLNLDTGPDGAMNPEATVIGAYLHGLFDSAEFREKFLDSVARKKGLTLTPIHRKDYWVEKERHYDRLADHFSTHVDVDAVINAMR